MILTFLTWPSDATVQQGQAVIDIPVDNAVPQAPRSKTRMPTWAWPHEEQETPSFTIEMPLPDGKLCTVTLHLPHWATGPVRAQWNMRLPPGHQS